MTRTSRVISREILPRIDAAGSLISTSLGAELINDQTEPGSNKVYGTNSGGLKGWLFPLLGSAEVYVDTYGAVGNGIVDDTEAIREAIDGAGVNGIIRFTFGKTYLITNGIPLPEGLTVIGYGAKLKRDTEQYTTLSVQAFSGAATITVANGGIFSVGDGLAVLDSTSPAGGAGANEGSGSNTITAVNGNVLTLEVGLALPLNGNLTVSGKYPVSSKVLKTYSMLARDANTTQGSINRIYGLEFDGNRDNNTSTDDWHYNASISGPQRDSIIKDCVFRETSCENIITTWGVIVDSCRFYNLNGSGVHISQPTESPNGEITGVKVINNVFVNVCENGYSLFSHNEGVITVSAQVKRTHIEGNYVLNSGTSLYGLIGTSSGVQDTAEAFIYNNQVYNTNGILRASTSQAINSTIDIQGNHFENCRWLWLTYDVNNGSRVEKGWGHENIKITDNTFINSKIVIATATNLTLNDNNFKVTSGFMFSNDFTLDIYKWLINLDSVSNYKIIGNNIVNESLTADARLVGGVCLNIGYSNGASVMQQIKSDVSTTTNYAYHNRGGVVSDNTIINFAKGILDWTDVIDLGRTEENHIRKFKWIDVDIHDNFIQMTADTSNQYGILAGPGCRVHHNKVHGNSSCVTGLWILGVNDGAGSAYSGTARTAINGAIASDNEVYGFTVPFIVGNTGGSSVGHNTYNSRVTNNYINGTISNLSSGNSVVSGNISMIEETTPLQILRQNTNFY